MNFWWCFVSISHFAYFLTFRMKFVFCFLLPFLIQWICKLQIAQWPLLITMTSSMQCIFNMRLECFRIERSGWRRILEIIMLISRWILLIKQYKRWRKKEKNNITKVEVCFLVCLISHMENSSPLENSIETNVVTLFTIHLMCWNLNFIIKEYYVRHAMNIWLGVEHFNRLQSIMSTINVKQKKWRRNCWCEWKQWENNNENDE